MVDEDYELIPKHELDQLRQEVEKLKRNPLGDLPEGTTLIEEVRSLNTNIKKLVDIFANTESDLAREYAEKNPLDEMRVIKDQNEQIGQGILALADMIKQMQAAPSDFKPEMQMQPSQVNTQGMQADPYGLPMTPPPTDGLGMPDFGMPQGLPPMPTPPTPERKKGLFGR